MQASPSALQGGYDIRFEWGAAGVAALGGPAVVIVDVLRFTTAVEAATSRGALVYPCGWRDGSAAELARAVGARVADGTDPAGLSLSPLSLLGLTSGEAVVLPSPNGSNCSAMAAGAGAVAVAACLRNAAAVAEWLRERFAQVSVIACGEQWPNGSLRPALEDYLGAGAVLARLEGNQSPEARAAVSVWQATADHVDAALFGCSSGRELVEKGRRDDVGYAAQVDVSAVVPAMDAGAYRCCRGRS